MSDHKETNQELTSELEPTVTASPSEVNQPVAEVASPTKPKEKKPKKKRGAGFKVLIVVLVVFGVLAAGGGIAYGVFHSNPNFCNFICHTPMDPYVASYLENESVNPAQSKSTATLSVVTHRDAGITCLDCHNDGLGAQLQEGFAWITGNYYLPLDMKIVYGDPKERQRNGVEFCLRQDCHAGVTSLDDLMKKDYLSKNPHDNHNVNQNCYVCHQMHEQSVLWCTQCHTDLKAPANWLTYKESISKK